MSTEPSNLPHPPISYLAEAARADREAVATDVARPTDGPCEAFRIVDEDRGHGSGAEFWRRRTARMLERQKKQRR